MVCLFALNSTASLVNPPFLGTYLRSYGEAQIWQRFDWSTSRYVLFPSGPEKPVELIWTLKNEDAGFMGRLILRANHVFKNEEIFLCFSSGENWQSRGQKCGSTTFDSKHDLDDHDSNSICPLHRLRSARLQCYWTGLILCISTTLTHVLDSDTASVQVILTG